MAFTCFAIALHTFFERKGLGRFVIGRSVAIASQLSQFAYERFNIVLIFTPGAHGGFVDWAGNLISTGCVDNALCLVRRQTGIVKIQINVTDQLSDLGFWIIDQIFVVHLEQIDRENPLPVVHQIIVIFVISANGSHVLAIGFLDRSLEA